MFISVEEERIKYKKEREKKWKKERDILERNKQRMTY